MTNKYHYTESGLDNVWLTGGYDLVDQPSGSKAVRIRDIEGLHKAICELLVCKKGDLTSKEVRFLRQEMLMTQAFLAKLLGVTEQTIHRWESGKADIPKPAESLIRLMYKGHTTDVRKALQQLADIEDRIDGLNFKYSAGRTDSWRPFEAKAA